MLNLNKRKPFGALSSIGSISLLLVCQQAQAIYPPWEGSYHHYPDDYYDIDGQAVSEPYPDPEQVPGEGNSVWDPANAIQRTKPEHEGLPLSDLDNIGNWTLVEALSDEFDSPELDEYNLMGREDGKWLPNNHIWGGRAPAVFAPKNVAQEGGKLQLKIANDESYTPHGFWNEWYYGWTSASVQNVNPMRYGYFEVKSKVGIGSSGFWLYAETLEDKEYLAQFDRPGHAKNKLEIDVYEQSGRRADWAPYYNMNTWVFTYQDEEMTYTNEQGEEYPAMQNGGHWLADIDFADEFHVYGLYWGPDQIIWYFDGQPIRSMENRYFHTPLYLLLDTEVMPDWFGMPSDNELDFSHEIEYVRVWTNPATEQNWRGRYFMDPPIKTGDGLNGKVGENRVAAIYGGSEAYRDKWGNPYNGSVQEIPLVDLAAKQSEIQIHSDEGYVLAPVFTPANVTDKQINWSSSDPSIAEVNRSGVVTVNGAGSVTFSGYHEQQPDKTISVVADVLQIGQRFDLELVNYGATGKVGEAVEGDNVYGWGRGNGVITHNTVGDYGDFYDVDFGTGGTYLVGLSAGTPIESGIGVAIYIDGELVISDSIAASGNWDVNKRTNLNGAFQVDPGKHTVRVMSAGSAGWQWNGARVHFTQVVDGDIDNGGGDGGTDCPEGDDCNIECPDGEDCNGGELPNQGVPVSGDFVLEAEDYFSAHGARVNVYQVNGVTAVNWFTTGDYLDFVIDLDEPGEYQVIYHIGTQHTVGIVAELSSSNEQGQMVVSGTTEISSPYQDWDHFYPQVASTTLQLHAGDNVIRLKGVGSEEFQFNTDKLEFIRLGD
ncbi:carbohydrate-binding protein [Aliagarivorans marinus]|uniref:carbohydrate-binding protein n=1 Tax=Aliagarivorans marinus TaxID=561965 RepID=UPI0003F5B567|nr:carbohydrate-binding protein [Aliagarivorans marinus]